MSKIINYTAPPTVSAFMQDSHEVRLLLGPYGSGKTTGAIMELMRRATEEYPDPTNTRRTRFVVVRNTATQLRQTVLEDIRKWFGQTGAMGYKVTDSTVQFKFKHGSTAVESDWLLLPLDRPEDVQRLLSLNVTGGWISEFREVPISIAEALLGRCGRYRPLGVSKNAWHGIIAESNPPDLDSEWYHKMEINRPKNWNVFKQPSGLSPQAENLENLRDGYYQSLIESNNEDWCDVHVRGEYGKSLSGQAVFRTSFRPDFHVTYNPIKPIPGRPIMIAQDFGRTPTALVTQVDNRGRLVIFDELTEVDKGIEQFCTTSLRPLLASKYMGFSAFMVADPSGRFKGQVNEESAFDALKKLNFKVYAAPTNDLDPRLRAVEQLLLRQVEGGAALLIDGGACPQLVQALKFNYRYKRKKSDGQLDDTPEKSHPASDLADCLQYAALGATGNYTAKVISEGQPRKRAPTPSVASWT